MTKLISKTFVSAALVIITAVGLSASAPASQAHAGDLVCGLLAFSHMSGQDTVYRGVGWGNATIVDNEDGRIVAGMRFGIEPGKLFLLHRNQAWVCQ